MKKLTRFVTTILLCGGGLAILTGLVSCKNFLNAGKVSDEIKEAIAYANAQSCTVIVQSDSKLGTFLSSGEKECKVGYSINLQFTVNADDYIFNGLKAVSSKDNSVSRDEYVEFAVTPLEEKQNTYAITVKLLKTASDILIIPDCTLIPRIVDFYPPFVPTGYDQDTTISITFSKPMDVSSFGDFSSIVITTEAGQDLKDYYERPYFTDDNKILNISTNKTKYIIPRQDDAPDYMNIVLNFNKDEIKDSEGFELEGLQSYTYRINKNVDNVNPVITDLHIYSTSDNSNDFYRELFETTDKDFEQWDDSDFKNNVVYKPYITIQGYDNSSGIESVHIKETLIRNKTNLELQNDSFDEYYGKEMFVPVVNDEGTYVTDASGKTIFKYSLDYEFNNVTNGLILLEISLCDRAGNESSSRSYQVIYETSKPYWSYLKSSIITTSNNVKRPSFSAVTMEKPTVFYKINDKSYNYTTYFSLEIYEDGKDPTLVKNRVLIEDTNEFVTWINEYFTAEALSDTPYNPHKYKFIRFIFEDERADRLELLTAIPPARDTYILLDPDGKLAGVTTENLSVQEIPDNSEEGTYYYTYKASATSAASSPVCLYSGGKEKTDPINNQADGIYTFYYSSYVRPAGSPVALLGDIGAVAVYYKGITNPDFDTTVTFPSFSIDESAINYERNSGTAKGIVSVEFPQNDYKYLVSVRSDSGKDYVFDSKSFEIKSGDTYYFSLIVLNSQGIFVAKSAEQPVTVNAKDNHSPGILQNNSLQEYYLLDANHIQYKIMPYDYDKDYNKQSNIDKITVFFSGKDLNTNLPVEQVTSGYYSKVEVPIDYTKSYLSIPIDVIPEGYYAVNFYIQDNSELKNFKWYCPNPAQLLVYYVNLKPAINIENDIMTITSPLFSEEYFSKLPSNISFNYSTRYGGNNNRVIRQYLNKQTKEWNYYKNNSDVELTDEKMTKGDSVKGQDEDTFYYIKEFSSTDCLSDTFIKINSFFVQLTTDHNKRIYFHPVYIYPDYYRYKGTGSPNEIFCNDTTWMKTQNGYQIFCDAPCFAHTMYCSSQLTKTNTPADAEIWEMRAIETGIAYSDGSQFSYTDKYLSEIPEGFWYTTIVHFADGTVIMGEVTQM